MRRPTTGQLLQLAGTLGLVLGLSSCASTAECTELACENEAFVTIPPGLFEGPYELLLEGDGQTAAARCLDASASPDNPEGLTCDAVGFSLVGHPLANEREIRVTITPDMGDPIVADVRLEAVDEVAPNGPDCPPLCFVRNGQVRVTDNG
ncbi:MAG: hypothetical protein K0V04_39345 [Deltaproteobacteria bacterium]|nr:hypothetical protein [Deltaproteobacteria bacterium]